MTVPSPAEVHDLIGIGFGPSNLALAIALAERGQTGSALFLEAKPAFAWHPDMLIDGADMQVSFLKDLVSLRNPQSSFSFLCYLHDKGRLARFINRKTFFPSRHEFNDYLGWAAARLGPVCRYDQKVVGLVPVERDGRVDLVEVVAEDSAGRRTRRWARNIVLAPGGQPHRPAVFAGLEGHAAVSHAASYLADRDRRLRAEMAVAVIGAGQSAAEIFADLAQSPARPRVDLILRGYALRPSDDTPFVNEIFDPSEARTFRQSPAKRRAALLADLAATNYAVADADLIDRIYGLFYAQEVAGDTRLGLRRETGLRFARAEAGGVRLGLAGPGGEASARYDWVVLATGYRRNIGASVMADLAPWIAEMVPGADYRLPTRPGFAPGLFVQGYSEATHGLSDTLLSVLALRAEEIAASLERLRARIPGVVAAE